MKGTATKLRPRPLPKTDTVKRTIALSIELKAMLDRYAELHAQTGVSRSTRRRLIPHMLAAFIEQDRGYKARRKGDGFVGKQLTE